MDRGRCKVGQSCGQVQSLNQVNHVLGVSVLVDEGQNGLHGFGLGVGHALSILVGGALGRGNRGGALAHCHFSLDAQLLFPIEGLSGKADSGRDLSASRGDAEMVSRVVAGLCPGAATLPLPLCGCFRASVRPKSEQTGHVGQGRRLCSFTSPCIKGHRTVRCRPGALLSPPHWSCCLFSHGVVVEVCCVL
jgi:hypothetical protein